MSWKVHLLFINQFYCGAVDSAAGSNAGPFGDGSFHSSGNLDDVEEADIEAGQILTALKSSPSPIRSDSDFL